MRRAGRSRWRASPLYFVTGAARRLGIAPPARRRPTATATTPGEAAAAPEVAAKHFLDTYVKSNGRVAAHRPGRRHRRRGPGLRDAARRRDRRREALRLDLGLDQGATSAATDGLIAFLWKDGKIVDPKPASDADVDAARALLTASCRFNRPGCAARRSSSARRSWTSETTDFQDAPLLVAGPWAARTPSHAQPQLLLARHVRGARRRDRRRPLGQPWPRARASVDRL